MGYRSDVRMVIQGPKELILAGFAALALIGDQVMQEARWEPTCANLRLRHNPFIFQRSKID